MKFLKSFLPNLTIALSVALVVLIYLDNRNPMMGFLYGKPFAIFSILLAACSIAVSVMSYISWYKERASHKRSCVGKFEKGAKNARSEQFDSAEEAVG